MHPNRHRQPCLDRLGGGDRIEAASKSPFSNHGAVDEAIRRVDRPEAAKKIMGAVAVVEAAIVGIVAFAGTVGIVVEAGGDGAVVHLRWRSSGEIDVQGICLKCL